DSVTVPARLRLGLSELAEQLPPLIGAARRRATAGDDEGDGGVQCVLLPSGSQEAAFIARRLRELHLFDDVPWSDIAVVVRGHHQLTRLRRALAHEGVPVQVPGAAVPLR